MYPIFYLVRGDYSIEGSGSALTIHKTLNPKPLSAILKEQRSFCSGCSGESRKKSLYRILGYTTGVIWG